MEPLDNPYPVVADGFARALGCVTASQWALETPCEKWDVEQLVRHVIATHRRVYSLLGTSTSTDGPEHGDLVPEWETATKVVREALASPELANAPVRARSTEQSFATVVGGLLTIDTLCHTWDLARAVGADETLDAAAVARAHGALSALGDLIRVPGGFAPAIEPAPGADSQTRFLNLAGRRA
jgi:uncharacterized protein (TIGR03086 family)